MAYAELIEEAKDLNESNISEVIDFIKFLKAKNSSNQTKIIFDEFKDGLRYMADDFDDTPDCFKYSISMGNSHKTGDW